jgi:tRNA-2-methylthio-N6-dimethylallyladenosine synthase
MPQSYYIWTIGCQMNKAESERLAAYLEYLGFQSAEKSEEADLIILNSCVVRQSAENRVVNKLHTLKALKKTRPNATLAVTGCLVESDTVRLKNLFPFVDYFFPAGAFPEFLGEYHVEKMLPRSPQVATYVPIMQGCDNFCSYCIVPYRRGRERSRPLVEVVKEVSGLVARGVKEITLLGQNVDSYGHDLPGQPDLADLLRIINPIKDLLRIRFLTNHPKDMKEKLIDAVADLDKVCEQINLPVQAGDDITLKAMRRGYTVDHFRNLIDHIRSKIPYIALSTDVIVGFPGETDDQFMGTYNLLADIRFDKVHVASYSPRAGTLAAREMTDDVPAEIKSARLEKIEKLQSQIGKEINGELQNTVLEVLVEGLEKGRWFGRTRTDKLVFFRDENEYQSKLVKIKINHTSPWSLSGVLLSE